jgi:hypothetical protein
MSLSEILFAGVMVGIIVAGIIGMYREGSGK